MTRAHSRRLRGERLRMGAPHGHSPPGGGWPANRERGNTSTFIGAPTLRGMTAAFVISDPINRATFEACVERVLVPELRPGDIVVIPLDDASHRLPGGETPSPTAKARASTS